MNIFQLNRILNQMDSKQNLINQIEQLDQTIEELNDQKINNDKIKFYDKIARIVHDKTERFDGADSLREEISNQVVGKFNLRTHEQIGLNGLLEHMPPDILQIFKKNSTNSIGENFMLSSLFPADKRKSFIQTVLPIRNIKPHQFGAFQVLLGMLFNGKKIKGAGKKGDLDINGTHYQVKVHGSGWLDSGIKLIQQLEKQENTKQVQKLKSHIQKLQKRYNIQSAKGAKHANKFAEQTYGMIFEKLPNEEKQKCVLYGFFALGYENLIICRDSSVNGGDAQILTIKRDTIQKILNSEEPISNIGLQITIPSETKESLTTNFGQCKVWITKQKQKS